MLNNININIILNTIFIITKKSRIFNFYQKDLIKANKNWDFKIIVIRMDIYTNKFFL